MPKRSSDADNRRFFDEFERVKVSRFRAMGVIDPAKREALIPFPNGKVKLIGTGHVRLKYGGGYSYFVCPKCNRLAGRLYLIDDAPLCVRCCDKLGIKHASKWGFGRAVRRQASDQKLDELIAKLETTEPLRFKPAPASWQGKAKLVYHSQSLTRAMRRRMISLRLNQLASQYTKDNDIHLKLARAYKPRSDALAAIPELQQVWKARTHETLQQALDKAQVAILNALDSKEPKIRLIAARLMLRTKQARERGFTGICT
jgi:hypothetical protein